MDLTTYITTFVSFANNYIIPFLSAIAFLFFIFFAIKYFVFQGGSEEGREKAKALALYSVLAFVFILVFWGIVNALTSSAGLANFGANNVPCSDYQQLGGRGCTTDPNDGNATADPAAPVTPSIGGVDTGNFGAVAPGAAADTNSQPNATTPTAPAQSSPDGLGLPPIDTSPTPSIANSPIAQQTIVNNVNQFSQNFAANTANTTYGPQAGPIVADSVSALNDPNSTILSRGTAVARLYNNGLVSDTQFTTYVNSLNAQAQQTGQPTIDVVSLRNTLASQPTPALQASQANTTNAIYNALLYANRSIWQSRAAEARQSQVEVDTLMSIHPPSARLAAFDKLVASKLVLSSNLPTANQSLRKPLLADINAERFLNGQPPLTQEQQVNTAVIGTSSAGS